MSNSKLLIKGGNRLSGQVTISGSKNAALPLMTAALLTNRPINLSNVPLISDVRVMKRFLESYGVSVTETGEHSFCLLAGNPRTFGDQSLSEELRASTLILGPLLARQGEALVYKPGGDDITRGTRGVDFHITALRSMGAIVEETAEYIRAYIPQGARLRGKRICLPKVSVGATQNIMMAACAADGKTVIENASIEPETMDLMKLLKNMGAQIEVDKPNREIVIQGKPIAEFAPPPSPYRRSLPAIDHTVIPDRIEAATYAIAAIITGGEIELKLMNDASDEMILNLLEAEFWRILASGAAGVTRTSHGVMVTSQPGINPVNVKTSPYPGFPTDLHPQWAALMCFCTGNCWIEENVFDGRFNYVQQLRNMGVAIEYDGQKTVNISGNNAALHINYQRQRFNVEATDIRGGAALVLVALARKGIETKIGGVTHLDRGYEDFVAKFRSCGADMQLV